MFNRKIYNEGLRRIMVGGTAVGILLTVLSCLVAALITIRNNSLIAMPLYTLQYFAPVLAYSMFGFLFKRRDCDLFHAIPAKRRTVYFSLLLALVSWIVGITVMGIASSSIIWALRGGKITFLLMLSQALQVIITSLFVTVFVLVSIMIAGTFGTSLVLAVSTVVYPPIFLSLFSASMELIPTFDSSAMLFTTENYLPFRYGLINVLGVVGRDSVSVSPIVVVADIAVILIGICLAGVLYCRRKSEYAGDSTPSKFVEFLICTIFSSLPVMYVGYAVSLSIIKKTTDFGNEGLVVSVTLSLLIWFLYELITTKSIKKMIRSVRMIWILPAIVCVMVCSVMGVRYVYSTDIPDSSDVESVTIRKFSYTDKLHYWAGNTSTSWTLDNDELEEMLVRELKNQSDSTGSMNRVLSLTYNLKNGRELKRIIKVSQEYADAVYDALVEDEEFLKHATDIDIAKCEKGVEMTGMPDDSFSDERFWELFIEDYNSLSSKDKWDYLNLKQEPKTSYVFIWLKSGYCLSLQICRQYSPNAMDYLLKHIVAY